jgi:hypothetical protein
MKSNNYFIRESAQFNEASKRIEAAFLIKAGLPSQVFRPGFSSFAFEEFDWTLSDTFWPSVQGLAKAEGDDSILVAVLNPNPETYFKKEFGYYNWLCIPTSQPEEVYLQLINSHPDGSEADSIRANSDKVVWISNSCNWAIWGERELDTCVLATRVPLPSDSWRSTAWALKSCLPNAFKGRVVPPEFATKLRRNFGDSL